MPDQMDIIRDNAAKASDRKAILAEAIVDIAAAIPVLQRVRVGDLESGHVSGLDIIEAACARVRASLV